MDLVNLFATHLPLFLCHRMFGSVTRATFIFKTFLNVTNRNSITQCYFLFNMSDAFLFYIAYFYLNVTEC